ncbi:hscarg dehydrogenase [Colletotrichum karsti]|uniref:Hscarg dehydrogenase n=1 Tax=Colletotrichum karsti TaxID=1095194 RepID=A0A9P6LJY3_9PEZI|nr:hscarg dehydrogenase [Colletotrichum karsti]KAF9875430.1 hscarg dehydrogenase [Colletotrichum karsti]
MSIVCVLGATGAQGGSVCNALKQNPNFKVRAITRNATTASAKRLSDEGFEVVAADTDDEGSLIKAFDNASAIFALTNYDWETAVKTGRDAAGEQERQQSINIAKAAAKIPTLKHYVLSSLPPAGLASKGQLKVPHFDYKQEAYRWIVINLPELAAKTTELWLGYYASNLGAHPMTKLLPIPMSGSYVWLQPSKPDALLPIAGDLSRNAGVVVEGILEAGEKAFGKVAVVVTDYVKMTDLVKIWGEVTGKNGIFVEVTDDAMQQLWGNLGAEFGSQLRWSEHYPSWHDLVPSDKLLSLGELGVENKVSNFRQGLEAIKGTLA